MGKKRMVCFFSFIIAVLFIVVGSFFGDGFPKIVTTITAYAVSGISAYKLGKISMDELKNLQKIALIILAATVIMAVDLGVNYFTALNSGKSMVEVSSYFAWLIFGDYNWSLHRFLIGFKNSVAAAALVAGRNLYLLAARLKNR